MLDVPDMVTGGRSRSPCSDRSLPPRLFDDGEASDRSRECCLLLWLPSEGREMAEDQMEAVPAKSGPCMAGGRISLLLLPKGGVGLMAALPVAGLMIGIAALPAGRTKSERWSGLLLNWAGKAPGSLLPTVSRRGESRPMKLPRRSAKFGGSESGRPRGEGAPGWWW